jgi:hypothetical protein
MLIIISNVTLKSPHLCINNRRNCFAKFIPRLSLKMVAIWTLIALTACSIVSVTPQTIPPSNDFWGGFANQAKSQFQGYWKNMQDFGSQFASKAQAFGSDTATNARNFGTQVGQKAQSFGMDAANNARSFGGQVSSGAVNATQKAGDGLKQFASSAQNFFAQRAPTV